MTGKPRQNLESELGGYPSVCPYRVGQRVQAHPATDTFMKGDRYGIIEDIGPRPRYLVYVRMALSDRLLRFHPDNLILQDD